MLGCTMQYMFSLERTPHRCRHHTFRIRTSCPHEGHRGRPPGGIPWCPELPFTSTGRYEVETVEIRDIYITNSMIIRDTYVTNYIWWCGVCITMDPDKVDWLRQALSSMNPWWRGSVDALEVDGLFPRVAFEDVLESVSGDLVTSLTGPRQVGKTTMLRQCIRALIEREGVAPRAHPPPGPGCALCRLLGR